MSFEFLTCIILTIISMLHVRLLIVSSFRESYYKEKLKNRDVDTSHIDNIGIIGILNL
jgi:hypothetical protein